MLLVTDVCEEKELIDTFSGGLGIVPEQEARGLMKQLLGAIAYLHDIGYVHRDLSVDNIIVDVTMNN